MKENDAPPEILSSGSKVCVQTSKSLAQGARGWSLPETQCGLLIVPALAQRFGGDGCFRPRAADTHQIRQYGAELWQLFEVRAVGSRLFSIWWDWPPSCF